MKITIINGVNLNLLGYREENIYGNITLSEIEKRIKEHFPEINFTFFQSNIEGEIVNKLHEAEKSADAVILNAGGYTHTSVAIADAIAAIKIPVVEVHISNIFARESYRHISITGQKSNGIITGFGWHSYIIGVFAIQQILTTDND